MYGYGPSDLNYPTIVGFSTLSDAIAKCERFIHKGSIWDSKKHCYVPNVAPRVEAILYREKNRIGTVVGVRQNDGSYVTSVYFSQLWT